MTVDSSFFDDVESQQPSILPELVPGRVLHIDADILAYYCAGNDDTPLATARTNLWDYADNLRAFAGAERIVMHITGPTSDKGQRYIIAKSQPYQGQRTHGQRPKNWEGLRAVLENAAINDPKLVKQWDDREADDGMAQAGWQASMDGKHNLCVIYSSDKDLRQVPGLYLEPGTLLLKNRTHSVDREAEPAGSLKHGHKFHGVWFLLYQMLCGDTADNIPGVKALPGDFLLEIFPDLCSAKARSGKEPQKDKPVGSTLAADILTYEPIQASDAYIVVQACYQAKFAADVAAGVELAYGTWKEWFMEQWQLLGLMMPSGSRTEIAKRIKAGEFDYQTTTDWPYDTVPREGYDDDVPF